MKWNESLELYREFKVVKRREPMGSEKCRAFNLGSWCGKQRRLYNKGKLSEERIRLLTEAGFVFDVREMNWRDSLALYKEFKTVNGREPVVTEKYRDFNIGAWCNTQRTFYKTGKLSEERIRLLTEAEFRFDTHDLKWNISLELYRDFKVVNQREPMQIEKYRGVNIGRWCNNQRTFYNTGKLSEERIRLLTEAGFVFEPRSKK